MTLHMIGTGILIMYMDKSDRACGGTMMPQTMGWIHHEDKTKILSLILKFE